LAIVSDVCSDTFDRKAHQAEISPTMNIKKPRKLALALACFAVGSQPAVADVTIFTNGKVLTVNKSFEITHAVAVEDGRIKALGDNAAALAKSTPGATVINLQGRTLLPGLMDSHAHPVGAANYEHDHEIPDIQNIRQLLDYISDRARRQPEGSLITVRQVFITRLAEQRYPTRAELDTAAPRHPVHFSTGPDSMLNSLALKLAGIDRHFQLPKDSSGLIVKDPQGEPTGMIRAFAPKIAAPSAEKSPTAAETQAHLVDLFKDYNSVGFTTIADRGASAESVKAYQELRDAGRLTVRLRVSHTIPSEMTPWAVTEKAIDELVRHPLRRPDPFLQIIGTKIWLDGGMLTGSALMQEPWGVSTIYGITDPLYRGVQRTPSTHLAAMVKKVAQAGLQFTAHSVGDGAVQLLLDVYDQVNRELPIQSSRPCITHCNFMTPASIAQAARLGVMVDLQPIWFYLDAHTLAKQFGEPRMARFQPLRAMIDAGLVVGGGSDHMQKIGSLRSVNPYNPWLGMWIAVSRQARFMNQPLHPESGLTRAEAVRLYTVNNARILFQESETGSLEVGKRADLIIVDRDILECPLDDLKETRVLETWLGGKRVWQRP
jgi:predicted amidohydrolase YtcJ